MVEKSAHRVNSFSAGWAARYNNAFPACAIDGRVGGFLFVNCSKQNGFLHNGSRFEVQNKRRQQFWHCCFDGQGQLPSQSNCKGRLGLPCAVTPRRDETVSPLPKANARPC